MDISILNNTGTEQYGACNLIALLYILILLYAMYYIKKLSAITSTTPTAHAIVDVIDQT